jgi:HlyD family secretion protein
MSSGEQSPARRSIRKHLFAGLGTAMLIIFGFGGWAATADLAGAVLSSGVVVVEGSLKRVQHREGGIVGEIAVRDGDRVKENDLLVRLDDTLTRANLAIVEKQIDQLSTKRMRLVAEREGAAALTIPFGIKARMDQPEIAELAAAEESLFVARHRTIEGQKRQLGERIAQIRREMEGLEARRIAKNEELALIEQELEGVRNLHRQGLIPFPRLAELQRMKAQLAGEHGQLIAEIARAATRITETELQKLQLDQDRRAEVLTELGDIDGKLAQLAEQSIAAKDQLKRVEIRAPQDGIVHQLAVHTIGGVIGGGETVMLIVPDSDALIVETRLQPADIDQVHIGQEATLRFSAFNQRTTPEIVGRIKNVAADLTQNPETDEAWYVARVEISSAELSRLGALTLMPGMPVEAFIQTGERTALSYLLRPLLDQISRAMIEE